jgi:hypothetical protein
LKDGALQDLVAQSLARVETARRELAGEERLARIAAVEEELRSRFARALSGEK